MTAETLWAEYIKKFPEHKNAAYDAWHFCDNQEDADELAELTVSGVKTATASAYFWYEDGTEPLPTVGGHSVILNWAKEAVCIIRMTNITVVPFCEVSAEQAYKEGEGDRSLAYWREVHKQYFERDLIEAGYHFDENIKVVCQEFKVVFGP